MNDIAWIFLSFASGVVLGAFFFGGLWWTVHRLPTFEHPALMVLCSLLLRSAVALGGFFVLSSGHWQRLLGCLAGFALARLLTRLLTSLLARRTTRLERRPTAAPAAPHLENLA